MKVTVNRSKKPVCLNDVPPGTIVSTSPDCDTLYFVTDRYCRWDRNTQKYVLSVEKTKHRLTITVNGSCDIWRADDCGFYIVDNAELIINN